jgi:hypothetical protein
LGDLHTPQGQKSALFTNDMRQLKKIIITFVPAIGRDAGVVELARLESE